MMKKTKKLKLEPMEVEEINSSTETSNYDSKADIIKVDPDDSPASNETLSFNEISIKQDPFSEISSELDNELDLNIKQLHEEIDLNSENDDSSNLLEDSLTEPSVKIKLHNRQKKKQKLSLTEESALRQQKLKTKHPVLPPCENCRLKCSERIPSEVRDRTNKEFWNLVGLVNRRSFIVNCVKRCDIKRRKSTVLTKKRNNAFYYYIKESNGKENKVCKRFFLTTLGFKASNDSLILSTMNNIDRETLEPKEDMRGKIKNQGKTQARKKDIQQHVDSFHPCVSNFKRDDSSTRRYLPSELTIKDMHTDFLKKYSAYQSCSYELYRNFLIELNVSFAKVGVDECDTCELFNKHDLAHENPNLSSDCEVCYKWSIHMKRKSEARLKYQDLVAEMAFNSDTAYYTADLQKPMVLPKMEEAETLFTRRLVTFNQSFIPLGAIENMRPFVFLWHEGIAGRLEEDIISAFYQFFLENRDKKRVVLWLEDSFQQNKNWKFLTFLVYIINSNEIETECIEIYYFEAGHSCSSTEAFFHQMETSLKRKTKIYDFKDFENAVKQACCKNVNLRSLTPWDFRDFKDLSSPQKLKTLISKPLRDDIRYLKAVKGDYVLKFRMNYDDNVELTDLDFLQMKVSKLGFSKPEVMGSYRGIPEEKKKEIIEKLVNKMPVSRRQFWYDLPEGDFLDLIDNYS